MKLQPAPSITFNKDKIAEFVKSLPFELTNDQRVSAFEILKDIEKTYPMNRLLNGDVGSGKTIVALIAAYQTALAGYQTAFMAPTEILANQHYATITKFLPNYMDIGLLTGSKKIAPDADVIIGTHALIQKGVAFRKLGLVVIDEQHRFGTAQRAKLREKDDFAPHLLSMTATPIPRTLALTIYGDLDITLLDQMPVGRKPVITEIVLPDEREATYEKVRTELRAGRQAYIICPRINEPDPDKEKAILAKSVKEAPRPGNTK